MRILMVTDLYTPIIGGIERHVQTLARELVRRGHSVAVVTLWQDGQPDFDNDQGVRVYRVVGWNRALLPLYEQRGRHYHLTMPDPGVMAGLRRVLAEERPDVVHARGWIVYSVLALKASPAWGHAKLVVTLHDYGLICPRKSFFGTNGVCSGPALGKCVACAREQYGLPKALLLTTGLRLSSHLHRHVDRFIAVSAAVAEASAAGAAPGPIDVIPTFFPAGVEAEGQRLGRPAFLPPQDDYILFVGQLARHKGLHVLLRAFEGLRHPAPLVLLGTDHGELPDRLPPGVVVRRDVPHHLVMAAWEHCALGVVPSLFPDPLPQVAMEAMACGKAIVAAASGGIRDLVAHEETGLLVFPGDADALREALQALLLDPARRARMGAAGRRRVAQYRVDAVAGRIERIYAAVSGLPLPARRTPSPSSPPGCLPWQMAGALESDAPDVADGPAGAHFTPISSPARSGESDVGYSARKRTTARVSRSAWMMV